MNPLEGEPMPVNDPAPAPPFLTHEKRAWLYRVALALLAVAQLYRLVDGEATDAIANVVSAVLGIAATGLATANTTTRPQG